MTVAVSIVAAVAANGVIGADGGLPWHLATDMARFKTLTLGAPVIMGRKTFETLKRPLPGRRNIVVTRNHSYSVPEGVLREPSLEAALLSGRKLALAAGSPVHIIGGGEIFRQAMGEADLLHITHVEADIPGDTVFPSIDPHLWVAIHREHVPSGPADSESTTYVAYRRAG